MGRYDQRGRAGWVWASSLRVFSPPDWPIGSGMAYAPSHGRVTVFPIEMVGVRESGH